MQKIISGIVILYMLTSDETMRGKIRNDSIANADDTQVSIVNKKFFGDITVIGANHAEAAEYLKEHLIECKTRGAEIILHFEVEEKFNVALDVGR